MLRKDLGDFSSIVCLKAIINGMEDALGEKATAIALSRAGRTRGKNLIEKLGLTGSDLSWDEIVSKLDHALGKEGTRLCIVGKIEQENDVIKVYTRETICSAGEPQGSGRKCNYTMGVVWGAIEQILGKRFQGKQIESVLRGGSHDAFEFVEINR